MPQLDGSTNHIAAWIWLSVLVMAGVLYLARLIKRSDYDLWESMLFTPIYLFGRILWRVHFENAAPSIVRSGGAILVANHRSSVDPCFVQLAAGRRVHWMVAREYCENSTSGPILKLFQVIPTNRSGMDTASTKAAIRITRAGGLVGMFPEGELNHTQDPILPVRIGAALIAIRAGVPIVPLWIEGSPYLREVWSPLIMPARVRITFGEPLLPEIVQGQVDSAGLTKSETTATTSTHEDSSAPADGTHAPRAIKDRKADLIRAEKMIVVWAKQVLRLGGHPDFPVRIAGRSRLEPMS